MFDFMRELIAVDASREETSFGNVKLLLDVIREHDVTELTERDRDIFVSILDDADAAPSAALRRAAERYKDEIR